MNPVGKESGYIIGKDRYGNAGHSNEWEKLRFLLRKKKV